MAEQLWRRCRALVHDAVSVLMIPCACCHDEYRGLVCVPAGALLVEDGAEAAGTRAEAVLDDFCRVVYHDSAMDPDVVAAWAHKIAVAALNEAGEEQHETFTPSHPTVLITESNVSFVAELAESIHLPVNAVIDQAEMKDGRMTVKWHVEPILTGTLLPDCCSPYDFQFVSVIASVMPHAPCW